MYCSICENNNFLPILKKEDLTLVKCSACGLVQVDDLPTSFNISDYDYYKDRISLREEDLYSSITTKRYMDLLNRLECYRKNNALLDIGCGEGHFLFTAEKMGWKTQGIDKAPYAVEICKKFNIDAVCTDLLKVDLHKDYYDVVVMFEVLEHLTHPHEYFLKVNEILRKGGILVITTPNFNCITRFLLQERWFVHAEHLFYFNPKNLKRFLARCNFRIKELRTRHIILPQGFRLFRGKTSGVPDCNQAVRSAIERNKFLSYLKYCMNEVLNLTKLGESIECICQKI